jgi:hypothetical protein
MTYVAGATRRTIPFVLAALSAACGGGGGGDGGAPVNRVPVASIAAPGQVEIGARVTFDGRGSRDPDGDTLTWQWELVAAPAASAARLENVASPQAVLQTDVSGTFEVSLTVNDGEADSAPASHVLTVEPPPPIEIDFLTPRPNGLVGDRFDVVVDIESDFALAAVTAQIEDSETGLVYDPEALCSRGCREGFIGTLSLENRPPGPYPLTVTVTDTRGNLELAAIEVVHDNPPQISGTTPLDESVALPGIAVDARCVDDLSGCEIEFFVNGTRILTVPDAYVDTLDLSPWLNQRIDFRIRARDSAGQLAARNLVLYVEDPARLAVVESLPGAILDVADSRLLYVERDEAGDALFVFDLTAGTHEPIDMPAGREVRDKAFLVPGGAIFVTRPVGESLGSRVYLWRDGAFTDLGETDSANSLEVGGRFAVWSDGTTLYRGDTQSGEVVAVSTAAGNIGNAVTADGTVVYWNDEAQIVRFRDGTAVVLTDDPSKDHVLPVADGDQIVYSRQDPACCGPEPQRYEIVLIENGTSIVLRAPQEVIAQRQRDYQLADGWAAFTARGDLGVLQVFTRRPDGVVSRRTDLGEDSTIDRLAGNGEVMAVSALNRRRYFSRPDVPAPIAVSSDQGSSFLIEGRWHAAIGRVLLSIDTTD